MLPPLFIGIALVAAMKTFAIDPSMFTIVAGHMIVATPVRDPDRGGASAELRLAVEQAARDLGPRRKVLRGSPCP